MNFVMDTWAGCQSDMESREWRISPKHSIMADPISTAHGRKFTAGIAVAWELSCHQPRRKPTQATAGAAG